jgi:hypothetical protein
MVLTVEEPGEGTGMEGRPWSLSRVRKLVRFWVEVGRMKTE